MSHRAELRIAHLLLQAATREGLLPVAREVGGVLEWRGEAGTLRARGRQLALGNRLILDEPPTWNGRPLKAAGLVRSLRWLCDPAPSSAPWDELGREMERAVEIQTAAYDAAQTRARPQSWADFEAWTPEGHNLHPGAKTRDGFSDADLRAYAPEFSDRIELPWLAVHKSLLRAAGEIPSAFHLDHEHWAVPVHPWQRKKVLTAVYPTEWQNGLIRDLDRQPLRAHLSTSLRTVHPEDPSWPILKLSVGSLMTSTERSMSRATVLNGPVYSELLDRALGEPSVWSSEVEFLRESGGLCWADSAERGPKARQLSLLLRPTLPQPMHDQASLLKKLFARGEGPVANLRRYCGLLIPVHIELYQRWGVALEAHLQNCVMLWSPNQPRKLWLRDWGGLRADRVRLEERAPDLLARLHPGAVTLSNDASARRKLVACLYSNHLTEIVVGLSLAFGVEERRLWKVVHEVSQRALAAYPGSPLCKDILERPWPVKALLRMRLDPGSGDLYHQAANPLGEVNLFGLDCPRVAS